MPSSSAQNDWMRVPFRSVSPSHTTGLSVASSSQDTASTGVPSSPRVFVFSTRHRPCYRSSPASTSAVSSIMAAIRPLEIFASFMITPSTSTMISFP